MLIEGGVCGVGGSLLILVSAVPLFSIFLILCMLSWDGNMMWPLQSTALLPVSSRFFVTIGPLYNMTDLDFGDSSLTTSHTTYIEEY